MSKYGRIVAVLLVAVCMPAFAGGTKHGKCSRHASLMKEACFADREDDYFSHLADCFYVTSHANQRACRWDARIERREKDKECKEVFEGRLEVCELVGEERFDLEFDPDELVDPNEIGVSVIFRLRCLGPLGPK